MSALYLIEVKPEFRRGRGRYWRPEGRGYTNALSEAGVFDAADTSYGTVANNATSRSRPVRLPDGLAKRPSMAAESLQGPKFRCTDERLDAELRMWTLPAFRTFCSEAYGLDLTLSIDGGHVTGRWVDIMGRDCSAVVGDASEE
jgi:hypothetical protein